MASYTIAAFPAIAVHDKTLVASTVDTVTFADGARQAMVISDGTAKIYVTFDGSTPTASGASTHIMPAAPCALTQNLTQTDKTTGGPAVKLISAGTPVYSVERVYP
jgi:hypothetical protein